MSEKISSLVVSEIFGPTISGEGPTCGQRCGFLRLGGCNLACSWCDTPYTWDATRYDLRTEMRRRTWAEIAGELIAMDTDFVIISGGEPLLQQKYAGWELLLRAMAGAGIRVEIETNGTIAPDQVSRDYVTRFMVSPKLAHASTYDDPRMTEAKRIVPGAIGALNATGRAHFKFVCRTADDVDEVRRLTKTFFIRPQQVWIMPEGTTSRELCDHLATVADPAVIAGFNVTTRLHVHTWGNERAR